MAEQTNKAALLQARELLIEAIAAGKITPQIVAGAMTTAFGGTDASGAWGWRTAYDVMQSAALGVAQGKFKAGQGSSNRTRGLETLSEIVSRLPTETRRSERQMQLQQFSTSLEWGWVAALAAQVTAGDVVLEPSDQITIYDTWARAFRTIHLNLQAALEATGVNNPDGSSGQGTGAAKSAAMSAFESTKQRFFGHLLQGIKTPTVIAAIQSDIEAGWAPVVQIVSTGEALLKRRIETLSAGEELTEASLTPREYVLSRARDKT